MARTRISGLRRLAAVANPVGNLVAGWLPFFGIVTYRGRKTGRIYRTPINVFRHDDRFLFFLTYGSEAQWVQNVLAAGRSSIRTGGRDYDLVEPELITDPELPLAPAPVRLVGRVVRVTEMLTMRAA